MNKTILITGASSGFGEVAARFFLDKGWKVIATMRRPEASRLGGETEHLRVLPLDVTSEASIAALVEAAGPVDVLVNNAGIGIVGAFEAMPISAVRQVFETNTFGVMALTQALLPQMRERRSGTIVNVTSAVTIGAFPLAAVYTASKQAIQGFSGSLAIELAHFGIGVKLVEPGYAPTTSFGANAILPYTELLPGEYAEVARPVFEHFANPALTTREADVAETIWAAIHDTSGKLRFPAGADAVALAVTA
ncbi:SDR family oxidoreductase [Acetobacteraceae bacterium H6797]|nr:SDR family oxidoreductase [Acetobacteraceae bacterium H6797]